jgi:hypothetical protein
MPDHLAPTPGSIAARTAPPVSVFCACGAQWHGAIVARAKDTIAAHRARANAHHPVCWLVPHRVFKRRFICLCPDCKRARG